MELRDLAVHLDHRAGRTQGQELAIALAARCDAHLTGVYVDPVPVAPEFIAMSAAPELLQAVCDESESRVQEARAAFEARASRAGVRSDFRRGEGPMYPALAEHARCSDLLVVTQESDGATGPVLGGFADHAVMACGRPVLVVPFTSAPVPTDGTVVVAWSGTRESARAANDALPLLALAARVEVVVIEPESTPLGGDALPGAVLAEHLARHGVSVEARSLPSAGLHPEERLLSHAADLSANLIVMGAYGHSRLRETVLGGMTRHLMLHMTVPVLMSH